MGSDPIVVLTCRSRNKAFINARETVRPCNSTSSCASVANVDEKIQAIEGESVDKSEKVSEETTEEKELKP